MKTNYICEIKNHKEEDDNKNTVSIVPVLMNHSNNESDKTYEFIGLHFFANYTGCQKLTLTHIEKLKSTLVLAIKESGATILDDVDYVFKSDNKPNLPGYTCAFILSESHATIHTYPEVDSCFVDLFTCGLNCSYEKFANVLHQYLQPKSVSYQIVKRETDMKTLEMRDTGMS